MLHNQHFKSWTNWATPAECRKIAAALEKELDRCGFNSKAGMTGSMYTRTAESNSFGADLHLPIHTNACNGKVGGLRIFVYKKGGEAEQIAKAIMATLAPITPGASDGISEYPGLYEVKNSNALCVYIEVGFHDNPEEAQWIIDHTQDIAVAIAKGLCKHYGVKYVAAKEETKPIYRVQLGAFHNRQNAEALMAELKEKGYEAFITS